MALLEAKTCIAMLVQNFDFKLAPEFKMRYTYAWRAFDNSPSPKFSHAALSHSSSVTLPARNGLMMIVVPRA